MTTFADATALQLETASDDSVVLRGSVPADWAQGRTVFGGLAAAVLIDAVRALPGLAELPIRSVDTAFVAPLAPGVVSVRAELLRRGKYLTHARAELHGAGASSLAATVHVVLGAHRPSAAVVPAPVPRPVPHEDCTPMPYLPGITPEFTRNLDFEYAGTFPFTGAVEPVIHGYCRHRGPASGVAGLAGLVDGWPGSVLAMLPAPAPASSVRWGMQLPDDGPIEPQDWHWYAADTVVSRGGHATITAGLWHGDRLVAWSEQLMAVFDQRG